MVACRLTIKVLHRRIVHGSEKEEPVLEFKEVEFTPFEYGADETFIIFSFDGR